MNGIASFQPEPWQDVLPRKCKVRGAAVAGDAPLSTGTGALLVLLLLGYAVLALDKQVPR